MTTPNTQNILIMEEVTTSVTQEIVTMSKFDGKGQDVEQWIKDYHDFCENKGWDESKKLELVQMYLDGEAKEWYNQVEHIIEDLGQFETAIIRRFSGRNLSVTHQYMNGYHHDDDKEEKEEDQADIAYGMDLMSFSDDESTTYDGDSESTTDQSKKESEYTTEEDNNTNGIIQPASPINNTMEHDLIDLSQNYTDYPRTPGNDKYFTMVKKIEKFPPPVEVAGAFSLVCLISACFGHEKFLKDYMAKNLSNKSFSAALDRYLLNFNTRKGQLSTYQISIIGHLLLYHIPYDTFDFVDEFRYKLGTKNIFDADDVEGSDLSDKHKQIIKLKLEGCDKRNAKACAYVMINFLIRRTMDMPLPNIDYLDEGTHLLTEEQKTSLHATPQI